MFTHAQGFRRKSQDTSNWKQDANKFISVGGVEAAAAAEKGQRHRTAHDESRKDIQPGYPGKAKVKLPSPSSLGDLLVDGQRFAIFLHGRRGEHLGITFDLIIDHGQLCLSNSMRPPS